MQEVLEILEKGKLEQERIVSNELITSESVSPERRKQQLLKLKKESLQILSDKLVDRVSTTEKPSVQSHKITYSGYFINQEEFDKITELLSK